jgi:hypothetical protein
MTTLHFTKQHYANSFGNPEHWLCVDCGVNTAPGFLPLAETLRALASAYSVPMTIDDTSEVYMVRGHIWAKAGMQPFGGCLCISCLEARLGRRLKPKDFDRNHVFNTVVPATPRLLKRQGRTRQ